jgi:hypothetical protein
MTDSRDSLMKALAKAETMKGQCHRNRKALEAGRRTIHDKADEALQAQARKGWGDPKAGLAFMGLAKHRAMTA